MSSDPLSSIEDKVFAAYGRAMHGAQALEYWLRVLVNVHRVVSKDFASQDDVERAVDTLSTSTMGTVFSALRARVNDPSLEAQLTTAVAERNRLAHQFFAQWAEVWVGADTDIRMIDDAKRAQALFEETVRNLVSTLGPLLDTIGSNPDAYVPGLTERIRDFMGPNGQLAT